MRHSKSPKRNGLKQQTFINSEFLKLKNLRVSLLVWFWLRIPYEVSIKPRLMLQTPLPGQGLEHPLPGSLTWLLSGRLSFSKCKPFPRIPHDVVPAFLLGKVIPERKRASRKPQCPLSPLASKGAHCHLGFILLVA